MEFSTKEELVKFLTELQGTIANLQEQMDKMAPVTVDEETPATETPATETSPDEVTDEEVNEIDALLQGQ